MLKNLLLSDNKSHGASNMLDHYFNYHTELSSQRASEAPLSSNRVKKYKYQEKVKKSRNSIAETFGAFRTKDCFLEEMIRRNF